MLALPINCASKILVSKKKKKHATKIAMLAAVHPQSYNVAWWPHGPFFFANTKKRLATRTPRPCHADDALFPSDGGAGENGTQVVAARHVQLPRAPAAAKQKTRKRAVDTGIIVELGPDHPLKQSPFFFFAKVCSSHRNDADEFTTEHVRHGVSSRGADGVNGTTVHRMPTTKTTEQDVEMPPTFRENGWCVGILNCCFTWND